MAIVVSRSRMILASPWTCCCAGLLPSNALGRSSKARSVHGGAVLEQIPEGTSPTDAYLQLVKSGAIRSDDGQLKALQPFERLHKELKGYKPPSKGFASTLLRPFRAFTRREAPRGVYVYGGVGTGKSLVADLFYHCSPIKSKRRVHFHQFMLDVHKRLHERRVNRENGKTDNIIEIVAHDHLEAAWLLCFDEFQLYKNGLQRELFLPCIDLIKHHCEVHAFHPGSPDYRLIGARPDGSSALSTVWYKPLNEETKALFEQTFTRLAGERPIEPTVLREGARSIEVPKAAGGIACFSFEELCGTPKGASDYLAIAMSFHTIFVTNIPQMTSSHNELVRRFITLIDVLYEQKVKLIASAEVEPRDLYQPSIEETSGLNVNNKKKTGPLHNLHEEKDEEFAFARTISRLYHMQSLDYLSAPWAVPGKAFICHLEKSRLQEGDLRRIWDRYNVDADSKLSHSELMLMMEDITEIKSGHRNVPEILLNDTFKKLDANGDGVIVWTEFRDYFLRYGLEIENL